MPTTPTRSGHITRDGTARRGAFKITVSTVQYPIVQASIHAGNASRQTLKDDQGKVIVQDWEHDVAGGNLTAVFPTADTHPLLKDDDIFVKNFPEIGSEKTFVLQNVKTEYSNEAYTRQTFEIWEVQN